VTGSLDDQVTKGRALITRLDLFRLWVIFACRIHFRFPAFFLRMLLTNDGSLSQTRPQGKTDDDEGRLQVNGRVDVFFELMVGPVSWLAGDKMCSSSYFSSTQLFPLRDGFSMMLLLLTLFGIIVLVFDIIAVLDFVGGVGASPT
jgi:hypothetical protein